MADPDDLARVLAVVATHSASNLVVVSGAGVSMEHPTHAPSGAGLMQQAMTSFFEPGTFDEVKAAYGAMARVPGVGDSAFAGRPRLEAVLDVAAAAHGASALEVLADNFRGKAPSRIHTMIAQLVSAGARSITANFDELIEDTAIALALPGAGKTHHFHGRIGKKGTGLPFGATLSGIEYGFSKDGRDQFMGPLEKPDSKLVAYIGYSFSDYFDATPATVGSIKAGALSHVALVLWFDYSPSGLTCEILRTPETGRPEVINAYLGGGIPVARLAGSAGDALYMVSAALNCAHDPALSHAAVCKCAPRSNPASPGIPEARKAKATITLLAQFGLLGRLQDVPRDGVKLTTTTADLTHDEAASYFWKKGRYREALEQRLAATPVDDPMRALTSALARAQIAWIRGAYLASTRAVRDALARSQDLPLDSQHYLESLERFGRIAVHVRRLPVERHWLLPIVLRTCPDYVHRVEEVLRLARVSDLMERHHLVDALRNFLVEVQGCPPDDADTRLGISRTNTIAWFQETESLANFADYIRGEANGGRWRYEVSGDKPWQVSMCDIYDAVGNTADVNRLVLQTAHRGGPWNLQAAIRAALRLDVTWWHRLRLVSRWAIQRLKS